MLKKAAIPDVESKKQYGLVMNGGGVKGIAFVGALLELKERVNVTFTAFGGASAGAITAAVLALGYDAETIQEIMARQPFGDFLDDN